jgi:hypothetical protein
MDTDFKSHHDTGLLPLRMPECGLCLGMDHAGLWGNGWVLCSSDEPILDFGAALYQGCGQNPGVIVKLEWSA